MTGFTFLFIFFFIAGTLLVPGLLRISSYYVVSGSMEPQIPVGSMIYLRQTDAEDLEAGDIIAFYSNGIVVTHRVTDNDEEMRELHTKGDSNPLEDMQTVPYDNVIGKYLFHLPYFGYAGSFFSSLPGRFMLIMIGCVGLLLMSYTKE